MGGDSVFATVSLDGRTYQVIFVFVFFLIFFLLLSLFVLHHLCLVVVSFVSVFSLSEGDFFAINFYAERLLFANGQPYF